MFWCLSLPALINLWEHRRGIGRSDANDCWWTERVTMIIDKNVSFPFFFFNSQCIDSHGRTFILLIKKCPILDNSMLSLVFGSLGFLTFSALRSRILRFLLIFRILVSWLGSRFAGYSRLHWSEFIPSVGKTVNLLPHRNWTILIRCAICIHTTLANASSFCFITFCKSSRRRLITSQAISNRLSSLRKSNETWLLSFAGVWTFLIVLSFLW